MTRQPDKPAAVAVHDRPRAAEVGDAFDEVLAFMQAVWTVDHQLERLSKSMETRLGLTIAQRMTLLLIGRHPGILASTLAEQLRLHRGTMTGIVQRLEAAGLVQRTVDASDGRRIGLWLTAAGRAIPARRAGTFEGAVRDVLTGTASADLDATARVLARLAAALATASGDAAHDDGSRGR
jgi:DNA-binding MarR family transcriptional regulator